MKAAAVWGLFLAVAVGPWLGLFVLALRAKP